MTAGMPSSEICEVCRSSGHDFAYLCNHGDTYAGFSHYDNTTAISLAPTVSSPPKLQEFQFLRQDDPVTWLFNDCDGGVAEKPEEVSSVTPPAKRSDILANFYNPPRLTLDVSYSSASSSGSRQGSPVVGISAMGQASNSTEGAKNISVVSRFPTKFQPQSSCNEAFGLLFIFVLYLHAVWLQKLQLVYML